MGGVDLGECGEGKCPVYDDANWCVKPNGELYCLECGSMLTYDCDQCDCATTPLYWFVIIGLPLIGLFMCCACGFVVAKRCK